MRRRLAALLLCACAPVSAQELSADRTYPTFAVGPTGVFVSIEPKLVVTVQSIAPGSPAARTSLKVGDVLTSVGGETLQVADPRVPLGRAIGAAEARGTTLSFEITRNGRPRKVGVKTPRLGEYGERWPEDCEKSEAIVRAHSKYVAAAQQEDGAYRFGEGRPIRDDLKGCLASLFLLSTGDGKDVRHVERHVRPLAELAETRRNAGGHVNWQLGYQGILLGEYYLRTGDQTVLAGLQELCNWCVENQAAGGWSHGAPVGPGYVQSGLMNHAGLPVLITLILARECGIEVDDAAFKRAIDLMARMVGHGCIAYGDHRSELWWSNTNGRNAMLACAFSLLEDAPWFQSASEHLALLVVDSYYQPEFGHTGGGFNVMWRGMASVHVPPQRDANVRRQMNALTWYYDLCRQPGGGFSMPATPPDNARYTGLDWGTGAVGLTYTAPRRTLRITGAPRTRFSVDAPLLAAPWGNDADRAFVETEVADGFGQPARAEDEPHEVYALLLKSRKDESDVSFAARYLRHYSPMVRTWAARRLGELDGTEAHAAIAEAIEHDDARVRRAAYDAISGYDNWSRPLRGKMDPSVVSAKFLRAIRETLTDSASAWWEIDGALFALGRAEPEDIRATLPIIRRFARHEDWYLREAAFWAIVGLHDSITGDEFQLLAQIYRESRHVFARSSYDAGFKTILKSDRVAFERAVTVGVVRTLGETTHDPGVVLGYGDGGLHEAAHRTMMILSHFDPEVYGVMVPDFVQYLALWEPYFQHSVWLITGSKWQPGILKVLEGLGEDAAPVVASLKAIEARFDIFDAKRVGKAGADLRPRIAEAVRDWESKYGEAR